MLGFAHVGLACVLDLAIVTDIVSLLCYVVLVFACLLLYARSLAAAGCLGKNKKVGSENR